MENKPFYDGGVASVVTGVPTFVEITVAYVPRLEEVARLQIGGRSYQAADGIADNGEVLEVDGGSFMETTLDVGSCLAARLVVMFNRPDGTCGRRVFNALEGNPSAAVSPECL